MVMVDELQSGEPYGLTGRLRIFSRFSHLTCDGDLEELHVLAARIGLKREWFQPRRYAPHYDLTARRRELALKAGAVFVSAKEQARRRLVARAATTADL